ncbi:MAG: tetratricopeptide repeat protein, partial [Spirochaetaceae bacterium]|nr:tetratricopeptide repeat protein [Spirochaetaceae bacterium]
MTDVRETIEIFDEDYEAQIALPDEKNEKPEIAEFSQKGYLHLKENQPRAAEDCFKKILELDPQNNYALVGMGDAARKRSDFAAAMEYYNECLEHHPGNNYALFGLADCYKAFKNYPRAIKIWEHYLSHDDKNITVLTRIADAYRKVRNLNKSQSIYQQVLVMEKDNPYALIGLGHLHYDFKEYEKALFYWERMINAHSADQVDIRVLTSVGNCHRKLKNFGSGIEIFRLALEIVPDNFYALFGMADCYRGMKMHEDALEYWNRILSRDPVNRVILTRAGEECRALGRFDEALALYEKALNIEFDAYAVMGIALINKEKGKYAEALSSLEALQRSDFRNTRLYSEIADCYVKLGQEKKAEEVLASIPRQSFRSAAGYG